MSTMQQKVVYLARKLPQSEVRNWLEDNLRPLPAPDLEKCRAKRLNSIASFIPDCKNYLEVGVQFGTTLSSVSAANKVGVDPRPRFNRSRLPSGLAVHRATSDKFFARLSGNERFDLIFLDGLHTFPQTTRDFVNAFQHLNADGVIVIDDVVPSDETKAYADRDESVRAQVGKFGHSDGEWFGDVWKLPVAIEELYGQQLHVYTVGSGVCGQAIIWRKSLTGRSDPLDEQGLRTKGDALQYENYFPENAMPILPNYSEGDNSLFIELKGSMGAM